MSYDNTELSRYYLKRINLVDLLNSKESNSYKSIVLAIIDSIYSINSKYSPLVTNDFEISNGSKNTRCCPNSLSKQKSFPS